MLIQCCNAVSLACMTIYLRKYVITVKGGKSKKSGGKVVTYCLAFNLA